MMTIINFNQSKVGECMSEHQSSCDECGYKFSDGDKFLSSCTFQDDYNNYESFCIFCVTRWYIDINKP